MIPKIPKIIKNKTKQNKHWSSIKESGTNIGFKIMLFLYKLFGKRVTYMILYPITVYYYCKNKQAKINSKNFLNKINSNKSSFRHFINFSQSMIDKLSVWNDEITFDDIDFPNKELLLQKIQKKQVVLF